MITPLERYPELATAIGVADVYFKREDLHPYGSHKGRSIPVMINKYHKAGDKSFAISSSGNAALAAAMYARELNSQEKDPGNKINLDIFVGNKINPAKHEKLKKLADENIRILIKERPLQALSEAINSGARGLRQSTDDAALVGYNSLAEELTQIKGPSAIFIGTSSGTTAQALASYIDKNNLTDKSGSPIQIHIVQTSSCHNMSDAFENYDGPDEDSIADAIVDKVGHRKNVLVPLIQKTGGRGWVATNEQIEAAQAVVWDNIDLEISTNSALSVAGLMQAVYTGQEFKGPVVCMICGD